MKIGLVYGGVSVEHEISIITALQIYEELNSHYEVINIYYGKDQKFYIGEVLNDIDNYSDLNNITKNCIEIRFERIGNEVYAVEKKMFGKKHLIDLAFLALHGASGEDGRIQGYFDTIGLVYTGPSHVGSSVGQDKVLTKDILSKNGISVLDYAVIDDSMTIDEITFKVSELNFPLIIKPAVLGSSVGITICENETDLENCINESFQYDSKLIVEEKVSDFMEVNCSVLGSYKSARASVLEEVLYDDYFSFEEKYMNGDGSKSSGMASSSRNIPAPINAVLTNEARKICLKAFKYLNLSGVVRFDLMIYNDKVFVNEVNTIPGSLSYYLWEASGTSKLELYQELIKLAVEKKRILASKIISYETNVLADGNFRKGSKKK